MLAGFHFFFDRNSSAIIQKCVQQTSQYWSRLRICSSCSTSSTVLNQLIAVGLAKQFNAFKSFSCRRVPNIKKSIKHGLELPLMNTESGSLFSAFTSFACSIASAICTPTTAIGWSLEVEYVTPRLRWRGRKKRTSFGIGIVERKKKRRERGGARQSGWEDWGNRGGRT